MNEEAILLEARILLAMEYIQKYHKNAILNGDWDSGKLIFRKINEARQKFSHILPPIAYCVVPPDE